MGRVDMAAHFRDEQAIPFTLLVDRRKESYRALELARGSLMELVGPQVWLAGAKSLLSGYRQQAPKQDAYQLGGALVIAPGGDVRYRHRAKDASDNAPVSDLLAALS